MLPHGYITGREVWFQKEKQRWIEHLANGGSNFEEAKQRFEAVAHEPEVRGEVSEWIEQVGRSWDQKPSVTSKDEDGLGAYFALSVAAGGWHSGALVLVNDELVQAIANSVTENDPPSVGNSTGNSSGMPSFLTFEIFHELTRARQRGRIHSLTSQPQSPASHRKVHLGE